MAVISNNETSSSNFISGDIGMLIATATGGVGPYSFNFFNMTSGTPVGMHLCDPVSQGANACSFALFAAQSNSPRYLTFKIVAYESNGTSVNSSSATITVVNSTLSKVTTSVQSTSTVATTSYTTICYSCETATGGDGGSSGGGGGSTNVTVIAQYSNPVLNETGYKVLNFTQLNTTWFELDGKMFRLTLNFISPTSAGVTINGENYTLGLGDEQGIGSVEGTGGYGYFANLTQISYLPILHTVNLTLFIRPLSPLETAAAVPTSASTTATTLPTTVPGTSVKKGGTESSVAPPKSVPLALPIGMAALLAVLGGYYLLVVKKKPVSKKPVMKEKAASKKPALKEKPAKRKSKK